MIRVFIDLEMNMVAQKNTELRAKLPHEIIEIGAVKIDEHFQVVDRFCSYVRPRYNTKIHWSVAKLTGIKAETLRDADYLEQVLPRFVSWLGEGTVLMYAWSDSDHAQIERECGYKQLWTPETRQAFSHWTDFQKVFTKSVGYRNAISLSKAVEYMGLGFDGIKHDALSDAENCARLLILMQNEKEYLKRRASFPPEPVRKPVCPVTEGGPEQDNRIPPQNGKKNAPSVKNQVSADTTAESRNAQHSPGKKTEGKRHTNYSRSRKTVQRSAGTGKLPMHAVAEKT